MAFFVHVMFISILYKFGSRVIYFSLVAYSHSFGLVCLVGQFDLVRFVVQHIRLVSFFVYFALLFSCTLHVRSLLVILCSFPCIFCCFQLPRVSCVCNGLKRVKACATIYSLEQSCKG